jgi:hypothetical protein
MTTENFMYTVLRRSQGSMPEESILKFT